MQNESTTKKARPASTAWDALADSLVRLETSVQPAVVPGDLQPWAEPVAEELRAARERAREYAREERDVLAQVLDEDPALAPRVEALEAARVELLRELDRIAERLDTLLAATLRIADDTSAEPLGRWQELRSDALTWIVDARAHHGEVGTWLREAILRDRGVKD